MIIAGKHNLMFQPRVVNTQLNPSNNTNLKQAGNISQSPSSSPISRGIDSNTTINMDLKQIKAEKISLQDVEQINRIKTTLKADAALANFPYTHTLDAATANKWSPDINSEALTPIKLAFSKFEGAEEIPKIKNGLITNRGLTAFLFVNDEEKEVRLVFGGTTSGKKPGTFVARNINNAVATMKQWLSNARNAFGLVTKSYEQAAQLAENIHSELPPEYSLSVSGHSKGGGEASYAALMLGAKEKIAIKSINFSSAQLGAVSKNEIVNQIQNNIPGMDSKEAIEDKLKELSSETLHVKIKGDLVPVMHNVFHSISHLGKTLTLPNNNKTLMRLDEHNEFYSRITDWVNTNTELTRTQSVIFA